MEKYFNVLINKSRMIFVKVKMKIKATKIYIWIERIPLSSKMGFKNFFLNVVFLLISVGITYYIIKHIAPEIIITKYSYLNARDIALYNNEITPEEKRILVIKEIKKSDSIEVYKRNQFLVNCLYQHQSIVANFEKAEKDSRNQVRLIYFTLLAAVITFILIKGGKIKILGLFCMIIIIPYMYYLDIHFRDLELRQHKAAVITSLTLDSLINISPSSTVYYNICNYELNEYMKNFKYNAENRKMIKSLDPDTEQDVLYKKPLIIIIILLIYNLLINLRIVIKKIISSLQAIK